MVFVHLKSQTFSLMNEKVRSVFEKIADFCRVAGGQPEVREDAAWWRLSCAVPERTRYHIRLAANEGGILLDIQRAGKRMMLSLDADELPSRNVGVFIDRSSCHVSLWKENESRGLKTICSTTKDVGKRKLFNVNISKDTGTAVIHLAEE